MSKSKDLFVSGPVAVNLGLESFHRSLLEQGASSVHVDWRPPSPAAGLLTRLDGTAIDAANAEGLRRLVDSRAVLVDIRPAHEVVPGLDEGVILHAGPPVTWDRMSGPQRGAVIGALLYEGLADSPERAEQLAASGGVRFDPCHHHRAVGPMAGVLSRSMWVFVVHNVTFGNDAYCSLNEGLGKVLRFGAYSPDVIERLRFLEKVLAPALAEAVRRSGGINVRNLTAQALQMGDECHNRNVAATTLFLKELVPHLLASDLDKGTIGEVFRFVAGNVHFFLNLSMAACKAASDTILGLRDSTLMSTMARNGTDIGIRVAGLGERWFTAPAGMPKGLFFPGFSQDDANPDLGDSTVSEVAGIGGFAMAGAPAIVQFVGGTPADALRHTREMYEICTGRHKHYKMPVLDFAGTPVGVDIRKVVSTGITPVINTGIAHRNPGVGQVGAGLLHAPFAMFEEAVKAFVEDQNRFEDNRGSPKGD
ncbi:MAG: DUF1116 domain-containing protein [Deltaproteobacteria bacterium]|nr:DUF1116 domain-containing protein [Deltaproteobacteria bacterium]